ncbi:hypothetical protein ACS0TY_015088 [Phlomoides rotata]
MFSLNSSKDTDTITTAPATETLSRCTHIRGSRVSLNQLFDQMYHFYRLKT